MKMRYLRIKAMVILGVVVLWLPVNCFSGDISSSQLKTDLTRSWFVPSLVIDADPVCSSFLTAAREKFVSTDHSYSHLTGFQRFPGPFQNFDKSDPNIQLDVDDPYQFIITVDGNAPIFVKFVNHGGCGGACESYGLLVADKELSRIKEDKEKIASTPLAPQWDLVKDRNGAFFALSDVDGHLQLYRVVSPRDWRLSCDVSLKPENPFESRDPEVQRALQAVLNLIGKTAVLSGNAGDCGSMGTPWRWKQTIKEELIEALYRPWALAVRRNNSYYSDNSHGDYSRIDKSLMDWSLGGIYQYNAYANYQEQLSETADILAKFYVKQYNWSDKKASEIAWSAISNAISHGFGFYMYEPYPDKGELELRNAILERKPIEEIQKIELEEIKKDHAEFSSDSILNIALQYPETLRYLLEIGFNPNMPNEFGKTPLMYAVQLNQLEATKILLAAGADPNAATIIPQNTCEYTIRTAHMTALHYAARYSSLEMIRLLINSGASTFLQTYHSKRKDEYPIDWLHRYTRENVEKEKNKNISQGEIEEAEKLLQVPSDAERNRIAKSMVLRAESDYAKGNIESAYRGLQYALAAQPDNFKAISDLPLVALKAEHIGPAIKAANEATRVLTEPPLKAAAWFNMGLVCEQKSARFMDYDGNRCSTDWIQPFIRAFQIQPTLARKNKLKALFDSDDADVCLVPKSESSDYRVRSFSNSDRIYIFHEANEEVDPAQVQVKLFGHTDTTMRTVKIADRIVLDQDAITIIETINCVKPPILCKVK